MYKQSDFDYLLFGKTVKSKRVLDGLRQEDLAHEIGCVRSTISKCERGGAIAPTLLLSLCVRFRLNILDYCTGI